MTKLSYHFHGRRCVGVNNVTNLDTYREARREIAADERATGAQLVAQWLGLASLYPDEMQRHLELLAGAIDDATEAAGSYEELRVLLTQIANGARGEVVRIGRMRK